eukprot:scaffold2612_cov267-Chaetoceros_neogracile.AAC.79
MVIMRLFAVLCAVKSEKRLGREEKKRLDPWGVRSRGNHGVFIRKDDCHQADRDWYLLQMQAFLILSSRSVNCLRDSIGARFKTVSSVAHHQLRAAAHDYAS